MKLNEKKPKGDQVRIRQPSTAQPATQRQRIFVMVFWGTSGVGEGRALYNHPHPPNPTQPKQPPQRKDGCPLSAPPPKPHPLPTVEKGGRGCLLGEQRFFSFSFSLSLSLSLSFFFSLRASFFSTQHHLGIGFFSLKKTRKTNRGFVAAPEV